ncbi:response regulator [Brevundimonas sp. S30B]|uniref:CHASE3 domain-containing protein n=1 Tax=unclassified Brevundimonas TaxID=2622653 RepID=UPI00107260A5|nr:MULTISPECIES: CHASE3 domain-containing protein [unclassified Brevundimonas]QBX37684.1 response regulator [Brevundimonas sp. MF30-B]TFW00548.1 response regulator [Brevundimonas sp. S30B]
MIRSAPDRHASKSLKRWLGFLGIALVVLSLGVMGFELAREFERSRVLRQEIEKSHETRAQIERVFSLLQDAETGQRGFIITGDERFLEPYDVAETNLDEQISRLEALYGGDAARAQDMEDLKALVARKQATLTEGIETRQQQGRDAALAFVASGSGKAAMDAIREEIDRMVAVEADALRDVASRADRRTRSTEGLVGVLFVLLLASVATAFFLIWRYVVTRRRLLSEVQAVAARQTTIFDSAIDAILTLNPSGSIETLNAAGERMFGWSAKDITRRDVSLLLDVAGDDEAAFLARLGARNGDFEGGLVREMTARRRDGLAFPVDVALSPMKLPTGVHLVAVIRDITERRRMEEMKRQFVSTVSHELRTPLTSIAGSLGLLTGGAAGALPDRPARLIAIAHANSQRLVRLINDILDMEKLESGQMTLDLSPVDLRDIAERSIESLRGFTEDLGVDITLAGGAAAPVRGDADRLIQVAVNLISNAAKFSPTGGTVEVSVHPESRLARLSVRDEGPGIPDEFRSRIFSKFAQADGSDTRAKGGTGLGLAIAREIAERHGGRLWFESQPGAGATFHLDLPMTQDTPSTDGEQARLLIVEDDADAAQILRDMLIMDGFVADIAPTAREALAAAHSDRYDAVLVDLQLPDADGVSLIRALRARASSRDLPVVVVSGDVARGRARGRSLEVVDWLEKPFDQTRLRNAVAAVLSRIGAQRPRILHVDDDPDILTVTASALSGVADMERAEDLAAARKALAERRHDLVILDLGLPDGSGLELLPLMEDGVGGPIPVIIYSAQETDAVMGDHVEAVLVKSRTSLATLARTVRRLTRKGGTAR